MNNGFGWGIKQFKAGFIDRATIDAQIDAATKKVLGSLGSYTRKVARNSVKYAEGKSAPGKPPHAHRSGGFTRKKKDKKTGQEIAQPSSPFRELIFFAIDTKTQSVVIGPAIGGSKTGAVKNLEHGGTAVVDGKSVHIAPRPTMAPAAKAASDKLGGFLKEAIN
jgi:hypothetical protein